MPRLPPPDVLRSWPRPNLVNPEVRSPVPLLVMGGGLGALALVGTTLRFYYRGRAKQLAAEDWTLLVSLIFSLALTTMCCWAYYHAAWGYHAWDLVTSPQLLEKLLQCILAAKILHQISVATCRISVLLFYTRLLNNGSGMARWWTWLQRLAIFLSLAGGLTFIIASIFQCIPVQSYWHLLDQAKSKCINEGAVAFFFGVYNVVMDIFVFSLPIPVVMKLKMPLYERISVLTILCLGFFASICAMLKAYYIYMALLGDWDQTWWTMPLWITATVENNLVIICACVPILNKPLFSSPLKKISKFFGMSRTTTSSYRHQYGSDRGEVNYRSMSNPRRMSALSGKNHDVSIVSKHDDDALPLRGIVVTREFEKAYVDRNGNMI